MHGDGSHDPEVVTSVEAEPGHRRWVSRVVVVAFLAVPALLALGGTASADELDPVDELIETATHAVDPIVEQATEPAIEVVEDVTGTVTGAVEDVTGTVTGAVEDVTGTVTGAVDPVVDQVVGTATDAIEEVVGQAERSGTGVFPDGDDVDPSTQPAPGSAPVAILPQRGSSFTAEVGSDGRSAHRANTLEAAAGGTSWWSSTTSTSAAGGATIPPVGGRPWSLSTPLPFGSGQSATSFTLLVLLAGLTGSLSLFRPSIRSAHAPREVACNAATLALSVERPG